MSASDAQPSSRKGRNAVEMNSPREPFDTETATAHHLPNHSSANARLTSL